MVYTGQQEECFNPEAGSSAATVRHPKHILLETENERTVFTTDKTVLKSISYTLNKNINTFCSHFS